MCLTFCSLGPSYLMPPWERMCKLRSPQASPKGVRNLRTYKSVRSAAYIRPPLRWPNKSWRALKHHGDSRAAKLHAPSWGIKKGKGRQGVLYILWVDHQAEVLKSPAEAMPYTTYRMTLSLKMWQPSSYVEGLRKDLSGIVSWELKLTTASGK